MDRNGFNDPYVKLTVGKKTVKSKTIRKTLNPRWDQVCSRSLLALPIPFTPTNWCAQDFEFRGKLGELVAEPMLVSAWDYGFASRDDPLGDARVDLSQIEHMPQLECIVKLKDQQAKPGEVFLSFNWQADGSSSSQWQSLQQHAPRRAAQPSARGSNEDDTPMTERERRILQGQQALLGGIGKLASTNTGGRRPQALPLPTTPELGYVEARAGSPSGLNMNELVLQRL
jgi:Ca2+-dependent lipid-binding protein